jgi:hypothetical protein
MVNFNYSLLCDYCSLTNTGEDPEKLDLPYIARGNVKWYSHSQK